MAAAAAFPASAATAQLAPGYSGQSGVMSFGHSDAWFNVRQLGHCLARLKTAQARALILAEPGSEAEEQAARALIGRETSCLIYATRLEFTRDMLRGTVAEALYRREISTPPSAGQPPPSTLQALDGMDQRRRRILLPRLLVSDFSSCLAAAEPVLVHRLITTTRLGTSEEREQVSAMAGRFEACVPQGARLQPYSEIIRLGLADALYKRAVSTPRTTARGSD